MRYLTKITSFFIALMLTHGAWAQSPFPTHLKDSVRAKILSGEIYRKTEVDTFKTPPGIAQQKLEFIISGLHPNSCSVALQKLSRYEEYSKFIDFVKLSRYNEKTGRIYLYLQASILPFNMALDFKIPRITRPGNYPFEFDKGFLYGLKGEIKVIDGPNKRCLFFSDARWQGPDSGIPDLIFELFTNTLAEKSMELLFRISRKI